LLLAGDVVLFAMRIADQRQRTIADAVSDIARTALGFRPGSKNAVKGRLTVGLACHASMSRCTRPMINTTPPMIIKAPSSMRGITCDRK
jgi:hypothetical protein